MVTLLVGPTKMPFYVHKNKICEASSFFRSAFESGFRETEDQKVTLPEDDVEIVDAFLDWIYSRQFDHLQTKDGLSYENADCIIGLFLFADKYGVPDLKTNIIDKLFDFAKNKNLTNVTARLLPKVWEHTPEEAGIRRLIVDWIVWKATSSKGWLLRQPLEVNVALVVSFENRVSGRNLVDPFVAGSAKAYYDDAAPEKETKKT